MHSVRPSHCSEQSIGLLFRMLEKDHFWGSVSPLSRRVGSCGVFVHRSGDSIVVFLSARWFVFAHYRHIAARGCLSVHSASILITIHWHTSFLIPIKATKITTLSDITTTVATLELHIQYLTDILLRHTFYRTTHRITNEMFSC